MLADPSAQLRLLDLQALDTKLDQLAHRRAVVPQIAQDAELAQRAGLLRDRLVGIQTAISDLSRDQERADADVAKVRERIARDQALLDAGTVASARQLQDLQHEIASLVQRVSGLEDAELEVMEQLEEAQSRADEVSGQAATLAEQRVRVQQERDAALDDLDRERERVELERTRVSAEVPPALTALYERIRADQGGIGAAPLHRGRCQGCQLTLTPAEIGRIRAEPVDEVLRCDECRRILVRTPESGL